MLEEAKVSLSSMYTQSCGRDQGCTGYSGVHFLGEKWHIQGRHQKVRCGNLDRTVDSIRPAYRFDVSCQGSVPEAIIAFLDGTSFEDTLRLAISLGGDSDTQAAIAGSMIAQAFYGEIPSNLESLAREMLDQEILEIVDKFNSTLT